MGQQNKVYQWAQMVKARFPSLSKPQAKTLAPFSLGMGIAEGCGLPRVAESLPALGSPATVERRLHRFIRNCNLDWRAACKDLMVWVMGKQSAGSLVVLLVDETYQKGRLRSMVVSVACEGRAVPLEWWCYRPKEWPARQVEVIRTLLERVACAMPAGAQVLVEADRGIGTSPELLRMIEQMGWRYLVRVQGSVRVVADGGQRAYRDLVCSRGQRFKGRVKAFKKAGWIDCVAVGVWEERQKEPWLLLTNLPEAEASWYALRWYEECAFRDLKSMGFQWQKSRVWDPERANRLWLVFALAYAWIIRLGRKERKKKPPQGRRRHSLFRLGQRLLRQAMIVSRRLCYDIALPSLPRTPKTVGY
jgi:hypothetical protein